MDKLEQVYNEAKKNSIFSIVMEPNKTTVTVHDEEKTDKFMKGLKQAIRDNCDRA